jgi:hypothetical protein
MNQVPLIVMTGVIVIPLLAYTHHGLAGGILLVLCGSVLLVRILVQGRSPGSTPQR